MNGVPVVLRTFHGTEHLVLPLVHLLAVVIVSDALEDGRGMALTVICNGGTVLGKLQRITYTPLAARVVHMVRGI